MTIFCDICPQPATVVRPATRSRELAHYCDYDARRSLGWGDSYHPLTQPPEDPCPSSTPSPPATSTT